MKILVLVVLCSAFAVLAEGWSCYDKYIKVKYCKTYYKDYEECKDAPKECKDNICKHPSPYYRCKEDECAVRKGTTKCGDQVTVYGQYGTQCLGHYPIKCGQNCACETCHTEEWVSACFYYKNGYYRGLVKIKKPSCECLRRKYYY